MRGAEYTFLPRIRQNLCEPFPSRNGVAGGVGIRRIYLRPSAQEPAKKGRKPLQASQKRLQVSFYLTIYASRTPPAHGERERYICASRAGCVAIMHFPRANFAFPTALTSTSYTPADNRALKMKLKDSLAEDMRAPSHSCSASSTSIRSSATSAGPPGRGCDAHFRRAQK